tara:strand:+ start:1623 stop:2333 length:711 start_codon:yes stop_codon:yes gene_type:complete
MLRNPVNKYVVVSDPLLVSIDRCLNEDVKNCIYAFIDVVTRTEILFQTYPEIRQRKKTKMYLNNSDYINIYENNLQKKIRDPNDKRRLNRDATKNVPMIDAKPIKWQGLNGDMKVTIPPKHPAVHEVERVCMFKQFSPVTSYNSIIETLINVRVYKEGWPDYEKTFDDFMNMALYTYIRGFIICTNMCIARREKKQQEIEERRDKIRKRLRQESLANKIRKRLSNAKHCKIISISK